MNKILYWMTVAIAMVCVTVGAVEVREIRVDNRGEARADRASVLAFTSLKVGDEFSRNAVNRDVKALQKTGRFSYVAALVDSVPGGIAVTYQVEAKPLLNTLRIRGADYLSNKKVRETLAIGPGDIVDDAVFAVQAQKVREEYAKRYYPDAELTWEFQEASEPGMVDVLVTVKEGRRAVVRRIRFSGNKGVSARDLYKVMKQREANWLSWITNTGRYSPDDLQNDLESIRQVLMDKGYLNARVLEPVITPRGKKKLDILISMEKGPLFRFQNIAIDGMTVFPPELARPGLHMKPGDMASLSVIQQAARSVRDFYGSRGYIKTDVAYDIDTHAESGTADVSFAVKEGALAYINNIELRGNTRTKDKVIRRELAVYPGDIFNEVRVRTSENRLRNLGYFSYVNSMPESTTASNRFDLVFDVEEQKTGQFMVGAGFSSIDSILGFLELSQGNFDLFGWPYFTGGGQKVKLRTQFGTERTDYEVSFVEPWFLNRRLSLGLDFFHHDSRFLSDDYDQRNTGGSITLGKPISGFDRVNLTYGLEDIEVYNVATNASDLIRQEEGTRRKSYTTLELVHDTRNNVFIPTRGNRSSISGTLAGGFLGGNTDLYGVQARVSQFWTPWFDHVVSLRGWAAMVEEYGDSDRVPIFDRLFLGGARTVRAFAYRDVGPKDETGEPIGGRSTLYGTVEYTIPLAEKFRAAVFYDVGVVWEDVFDTSGSDTYVGDGLVNSGAGLGVRLDFPGFPIQLDYSWPIEADEYNDRSSGRFSFWIGYTY